MPNLAAVTLRTADDWRRLVAVVREHAGPMAALGTPLRVMLAKKVARRRDVLNRLMWAGVLDQIAQQVCIGGQWFSAEAGGDDAGDFDQQPARRGRRPAAVS